jgi:hypothetical protein
MLAASPAATFADCQCLANGRRYQHGEIACLTLPSGSHLAQCDMVLNNSSWKKIQDGCPEANVTPLSPAFGPKAARPEGGQSETRTLFRPPAG